MSHLRLVSPSAVASVSSPSSSGPFNVFAFCMVDGYAVTPRLMSRRPDVYAWMSLADKAGAFTGRALVLELAAVVFSVRASLAGSDVALEALTRKGCTHPALSALVAAFTSARTVEALEAAAPDGAFRDCLRRCMARDVQGADWLVGAASALRHRDAMLSEAAKYRAAAEAERLAASADAATERRRALAILEALH